MASATEEKKRKILIAVDLSNFAEEAFKCKKQGMPIQHFGPVRKRDRCD